MVTHYGPLPENIDEIADAFGIYEEVLTFRTARLRKWLGVGYAASG